MAVRQLRISGHVKLNAAGTGTVTLGPSGQPGGRTWHVTGLVAQTSRPGLAPIPKMQVYQDAATPDNSLGLTYDGSFTTATADETLVSGQSLVFVWTGGVLNDDAYVTITGTQT